MPASILDDRAGYYRVLEASQKGTLDITAWLQWFLATLLKSVEQALARIDRVLDDGERGFENGISAAQYQAVAKVSKATATRHLSDLVEKGCLARLPGGGRSTRYQIQHSGSAQG